MQHFRKSNRFGVPAPKPGALPTGPHPDMKLRENARCGQICGQGNSTTFSKNFQRRYLRGFAKIKGSIQYLKQSNQFGVPAPKAGALPTALHLDEHIYDTDRYKTEICTGRKSRYSRLSRH